MRTKIWVQAASVIILSILSIGISTSAQTSAPIQLYLTWKSDSFYPTFFPGKALVSPETPLRLAVEAVQDGKFVDLSRAMISWFLDGKPVGSGVGMKETRITDRFVAGNTLTAKAMVQLSGNTSPAMVSSQIPVSSPRIVIVTPFPQKTVLPKSGLSLEAFPYFWNVTQLSDVFFTWTVNGVSQQAQGQNAVSLTLGTPTFDFEKIIQVDVIGQNANSPTEFAKEHTILNVQ